MSSDIQPLTSIIATPLVREKRHYPNEQKQQKNSTSDEEKQDSGIENDELDNAGEENMDNDNKQTGVKHIDEYV